MGTLHPATRLNPLPDELPLAPAAMATPLGAVSWPAVFAGATGAAALSLVLLMLGTGLGLSAASPWAQQGADAGTLGVAAILWIMVASVAASVLGGYIAGRLRSRWRDAQGDEVFFRDTVHGFLSWGLATLASAAVLGGAASSIVGSGAKASAAALVAGGSAVAAADPTRYAVDKLFRTPDGVAPQSTDTAVTARNAAAATATAAAATAVPGTVTVVPTVVPINGGLDRSNDRALAAEATAIFAANLRSGALPADDLRYLGQRISQQTGLAPQDAEKRVSDGYARLQAQLAEADNAARAAADRARSASAKTLLWLVISLLMGAFAATLAATWGGRERDLP
ncbi:MAG TPA: hypothetical protein VLA61_16510 [Ideonella sp.]|uniref:hypothetical protein n=1 Tax=Ideonella sp. TaxID=1929293 RepID=UPI002C4C98E6|nr:hypothetical protein [Ideonella sp.]HSI49876.1 hypothetical protein [Ideonella sp.]